MWWVCSLHCERRAGLLASTALPSLPHLCTKLLWALLQSCQQPQCLCPLGLENQLRSAHSPGFPQLPAEHSDTQMQLLETAALRTGPACGRAVRYHTYPCRETGLTLVETDTDRGGLDHSKQIQMFSSCLIFILFSLLLQAPHVFSLLF